MAEDEKNKNEGINIGIGLIFKVIFYLIVIGVILFFVILVISTGERSGFLDKVGLGSLSDAVRTGFGTVSKPFVNYWKIYTGENVGFYSLEGTTETREKTGLDIDNIVVYGGVAYKGKLKDDITSSTNILIYRFPDNVERFEAGVECFLEEDEIQGIVSTGESGDVKGRAIVPIVPDKEGGIRKYPVHCRIPKEEVGGLKKSYNQETIRYDLEYLRDQNYNNAEKVFIDVFLIDNDIYSQGLNDKKGSYSGREDDTFKELATEEFSSYRNPIVSRMLYEGDVQAIINFQEPQPFVQGGEYHLVFQFINGRGENTNVTLRGFKINLPDRFEFTECDALNFDGELKEDQYKNANYLLNNGKYFYKTSPSICKIRINDIRNIRQDELIKLDPNEGLTADLEYALKISKKEEFVIDNVEDNIN